MRKPTGTGATARSAGAAALDAWTRDDPDTLAWYRSMGFTESDHYLHVYASHFTDPAEPHRAVTEPRPGLRPSFCSFTPRSWTSSA
jgi:hypothetical protein